MASFDRAADATDPGNLGLTAARSAHPKSRRLRSPDGRIIAKRRSLSFFFGYRVF